MLRPKPLLVNVSQTQGMDSRSNPIKMDNTKSALLYNVDLASPGKKAMRLGTTAVLTAPAAVPVMGLCYLKAGGVASRMCMVTNKRFYKSTLPLETSGSWVDVPGSDIFTAATYPQAIHEAQGSVYCSNGTDSVYRYNGTSMTEYATAPKGKVMSYFKNRLWIGNTTSNPDFVYYSNVIDPTTWDTTNQVIKVYSGDGTDVMAMRPFMESSLLIFKEDSIHELLVQGDTASYWNLRPVDLEHGCVAYNCTAAWGASIFYLSRDGVRVIQSNAPAPELPLSWEIKSIWDTINFDYISRAQMIVHNNKLYVAVPTGATAYNNMVLVYDLTVKGWSVYTGWNVGCFAIHVEKVVAATADEEEILMYGDVVNGKVYKCFTGPAYTDATTAIDYREDTKRFDFDYPFQKIGDYVDLKILSGTATNVVVSGLINGGTATVLSTSTASEKIGLKGLGRFYDLQLRYQTTGTATEQLVVGEYTIFARPCGYKRT